MGVPAGLVDDLVVLALQRDKAPVLLADIAEPHRRPVLVGPFVHVSVTLVSQKRLPLLGDGELYLAELVGSEISQ